MDCLDDDLIVHILSFVADVPFEGEISLRDLGKSFH